MEFQIICDRHFVVGEIDPRLYGSFLEHMGRVIYHGIYEPGHPDADDEGVRRDVLETVKRMGVSCVRYPGGNFVSVYHWEDGVGPREQRPRRAELAWRSIETNAFGTDEFIRWAKKADIEPIFSVNLGTRGIDEAVQYLEYCNFPEGTYYSDLRRSHGVKEPYGVKLWCLGNEMDGLWQIGHKTAAEYGRLAAEAGRAMKRLDDTVELIVCGSSLSTMPTCPQWDLETLDLTYDIADYIALHQYYGGQEMGTAEFLAQAVDFEAHINTIRAAIQVTKRKKRSKKDIKISIDEWGVWETPGEAVDNAVRREPWKIAPAISEQIYTLEDALLFAQMQMAMLRNADLVKIACQSLLTNISSCIMTENGGACWLQTIYYPFACFANYAKGVALQSVVAGDAYESRQFGSVPYLDALVVWNEAERELAAFYVNRSETEEIKASLQAQGFEVKELISHMVLAAADKKMTNEKDHQAVVLKNCEDGVLERDGCTVTLAPLSFHMVRMRAKKR